MSIEGEGVVCEACQQKQKNLPCDTGLSSLVTLFINFALAADTAVGGDGGTKTRKKSIILYPQRRERERERER